MKLFLSLAIILVILICPVCAFAAVGTYSVDVNGATMQIAIPDGYDVFTKDMDANQPLLAKYELDESKVESMLSEDGLSLDSINSINNTEIKVAISSNENSQNLYNLSSLSDSYMDSVLQQAQKKIPENVTITWKTEGGYKYFYYEMGNPVYAIQYTTIVNGQGVTIDLQNSDNQALVNDVIAPFTAAVQNISFSGVQPMPSAIKENLDKDGVLASNALSSQPVPSGSLNTSDTNLLQTTTDSGSTNTDTFVFSYSGFIAGIIIAGILWVILFFVLLRLKNKTLTITQTEYDNSKSLGATLIFISIRLFIGIIVSLVSLASVAEYSWYPGVPESIVFSIVIMVLMVVTLVLLYTKKKAFVLSYITIMLVSFCYSIATYQSTYAGISIPVEIWFIIYIFRSSRVAVLYGTRQVRIEEIADPLSPAPSGGNGSVAASGLDELKRVNPIAYKRNMVAQAAGYRDFAGMVGSNPSLDKSLAFATSKEELDKVAISFGYPSFEDMYREAEEKWQINHPEIL
jgi:hypothetical protein